MGVVVTIFTLMSLWGIGMALLLASRRLFARSVVRTGDEPRCAACGYNLTGLRSFRCPECGTDFRQAGVVQNEVLHFEGRMVAAGVLLMLALAALLAALVLVTPLLLRY